jgi:hypothetical protein
LRAQSLAANRHNKQPPSRHRTSLASGKSSQ